MPSSVAVGADPDAVSDAVEAEEGGEAVGDRAGVAGAAEEVDGAAGAVARTDCHTIGESLMNTESQSAKVAVACDDFTGLEGRVSAHFGRCPAYTVALVSDGRIVSHEVATNPHYERHAPGEVPRFLIGLGANVVLAGGMGPRAVQMLNQGGVEVATGMTGTVAEAIQDWLAGTRGITPCRHDHPDSCGGHGD